eukprot:TRINITY_DN8741_c0_g1_i1.p1 TRINITY_DN8741_c0_g1~~TRINITY_DN8741_c0_g1_i1.p1  ORF type:complete len:357 (+),score=73.27 TRINITY_DN8741_c0_g1_i1:562-1632(+)
MQPGTGPRLFIIGGIVLLALTFLTAWQTTGQVGQDTAEIQNQLSHVLETNQLPSDLRFIEESKPKPSLKLSLSARQENLHTVPEAQALEASMAANAIMPQKSGTESHVNNLFEKYNIAALKDHPLPPVKGIEELTKAGVTVPPLAFDYDISESAKAERYKAVVAEHVANGMPELAAQLRAQLFERELADKKSRATHARNRAIVRLRQELRLRRDAEQREQRLALLKAKQEMVQKMQERNKAERKEQAKQKEARKAELEEKGRKAREEAEQVRQMKEQIRQEHLEKQRKENEARRAEYKQEKALEQKEREKAAAAERESKRQMLEEFQVLQQQQMEESRRLAREERLQEMQQSARAA